MNTYEREAIGNIIIIRNLIFQNTVKGQKEIDHAWKMGRPCLIIHSDDEYDYILALKTNVTDEKFENHHFQLSKKDFLTHKQSSFNIKKKNEREIHGAVNLQNVYKIPIAGHITVEKITFKAYKGIIAKLKEYHEKENLNEIIENAETVRGR